MRYDIEMKIKPEHRAIMKEKVQAFLARNPTAVELHYASLRRQDPDKNWSYRMRWDMTYAAIGSPWLCEHIYPYANDTHIDTVMRELQKELGF